MDMHERETEKLPLVDFGDGHDENLSNDFGILVFGICALIIACALMSIFWQ